MIYDFGDAEALRLVRAFYTIEDPELRHIIVAIAEAAARGAVIDVRNPDEERIEAN
jgi:hypothetical protein